MMSLLFYRQWRYLVLLIGLLSIVGFMAIKSAGRQEDPTITNLFATIITPYPGATSSKVEVLVTERIERKLREIEEITEIHSTSKQSLSIIQIELSSFVPKSDLDNAWSKIRDALTQVRPTLPQDSLPAVFDDKRAGAYTSILALVPKDPSDIAMAQRYAYELQDRLRLLPNTQLVNVFGENQEVVDVRVDLDKLYELNIGFDQLARLVRSHDVKQSAGKLDGIGTNVLMSVANQFHQLTDVMKAPVAVSENGHVVYLSDIATIEKSLLDPLEQIAYHNNKRAIFIGSRMLADKQVHTWSARLEQELDLFRSELPAELSLETVFHQNDYTSERINQLLINLGVGVLLVIAIVYLTMGARAAFVVATVIPLATLLSMIVFRFWGMTIHQMSVTGLIVSLGLLVDSAIVMTDEIQKRLGNMSKEDAISNAVKRLAIPLSSSTLTTILAFMPMALLPGPSGDFVGSIAYSVIIMLTASLILSLTVTPAIAGHVLSLERKKPLLSKHFNYIAQRFERSLNWSFKHIRLTIPFSLVVPIAGFLLFPTLNAQFFPGVDRNQFHVQVQYHDTSSINRTNEMAENIVEFIRNHPGVLATDHIVGRSFPAFYYNMRSEKDNTPSFAEIAVRTESADKTEEVIRILQQTLPSAFPNADILVKKLNQGPPVNAPVELRIYGYDTEVLREIGDRLRLRLAGIEAVTNTRASLTSGTPTLAWEVDDLAAYHLGIKPTDVALQLSAASLGVEAGFLLEDTVEVPVLIRAAVFENATASDVSSLPIKTPLGTTVPLGAIASESVQTSDGEITRHNAQRVNNIQAFVAYGTLPDVVFKNLNASLLDDPLLLPPDYRIAFGGDADKRAQTLRNLTASLGLVIALSILTIVLTFSSFRLSLITIIVCGLSMGLSILSLALLRYPFGIQAIIGVIGAIGVSVNAAIIILTSLKSDPLAISGDVGQITNVVMQSSRHIVSTTLTTFFGFLPLILEGGEFWPPFAIAIAGGVLLSMIVSFYFTPAMFIAWCVSKKRLSCSEGVTVEA